ncbi:hypothetical protein BJV74DRAFT_843181 [Russula compacta]|nr:hypothetical protein BJV74DRAFT_843181 [Russula compacta]
MQSTYSNAPVINSNPVVQTPLSGFKFSTIGQSPSLLERMSDTPRDPFPPPSSDLYPSQEQNSTTYTHFRPASSRPLTMDVPLVERESARSVKPGFTPHPNTFGPAPTSSLSSFEPPNDPQPFDQIRASVLPDLQYPNATPEIEIPPLEFSTAYPSMDQDGHHSSLPSAAPRSLPPVSVTGAPRIETGVADGTTDGSSLPLPSSLSQHSDMTTSAEPEQVRRPVEHLFRLASAREERLSKQREIFDLRSGELSTFSAEALGAVRDLQDKSESFKQQAEEMRAQAEQTLQEANKMRDMADRLIASAGALGVDSLSAKDDVGRAVDRSEQMNRFVRKSFDWLASLRSREQDKIALVQAEIAEQESAERARRQQELYQQLERRKIEEREKKEAAKREEELEAARKRAEEEREAARKRSYEMRRAEVMADKWRATGAHVQSMQGDRERRIIDVSGSGSSVRGSKAPPSTPPGLNPELSHNATSAILSPSPQAVPAPSRSSDAPEITPSLSQPLPSSNKVKATPLLVSFVPARTEVGRAVNTDSPLSSTTLASEFHAHNVVQTSYHPRPNQVARDLSQEQMQSQKPAQSAPTLEPHQVVIKREPSVELSTARLQPSPDMINIDQSQHRQQVAAIRNTNQDRSKGQYAPTSSISGSRATSLHVAQTEDYRRRSDSSGAVPPQHDLRHPQDSLRAHVAPSIDAQGYRRQGSVSRDRSPPRWNDRGRRSPSPPSWREPPSRSPSRSRSPHLRKRPRSRTPLRYEARPAVDHWEPERPRARRGRIEDYRPWQYRDSGYDRVRHGDNSRRYRVPPPRRTIGNNYQPSLSPSPPPSPRQFRDERSPPRRSYRGRSPSAEHDPQRYANIDVREERMEYRPNINARHHEPAAYEGAKPSLPAEEEPRGQQQQRQRLTPVRERDRTSTPSPRLGEAEIGLLDRINMSEADDRGRGRGRPSHGIARGGPNARRGMRGAFGSGRGRGGVSGSTPVLLSRMSETTARPTRTAFAPSLSDRMEQD